MAGPKGEQVGQAQAAITPVLGKADAAASGGIVALPVAPEHVAIKAPGAEDG